MSRSILDPVDRRPRSRSRVFLDEAYTCSPIRRPDAPNHLEAIVSSGTRDKEGHTFVQAGIRKALYRLFPIVLWAHDPAQPVGRAKAVDICPAGHTHVLIECAQTPAGCGIHSDDKMAWSVTVTRIDGVETPVVSQSVLVDVGAGKSGVNPDTKTIWASPWEGSTSDASPEEVWAWAAPGGRKAWQEWRQQTSRIGSALIAAPSPKVRAGIYKELLRFEREVVHRAVVGAIGPKPETKSEWQQMADFGRLEGKRRVERWKKLDAAPPPQPAPVAKSPPRPTVEVQPIRLDVTPQVTVNMPEQQQQPQPPPVIQIDVHVPEQQAPNITLQIPPPGRKRVERDADGNITALVEEES